MPGRKDMHRKLLWGACLLGFLLLMVSTSAALAAPSQQNQEPPPEPTISLTPTTTATPVRWPVILTPTPIPTSVGGGTLAPLLPTTTPSPTPPLAPPPVDGGRVVADVLYVREGPSFGSAILGSLLYNDSVRPLGRNAEGDWIAVEWENRIGWVWASLVFWDPALRLETLAVLVAGATLSPNQTSQPTVTGQAVSPTPAHTPTPTATLASTATSLPSATATSQPAVAPVPTTLPAAPAPGLLEGIEGPLKSGLLIAGSLILLGLVVYMLRRSAGVRAVRRYAKGFPVDSCPACREGHLHFEQLVQQSMGIPSVRRSARCDTCRSVLREVRPGKWRYTVDPYVNPEMASRYDTRWLTHADLEVLGKEAGSRSRSRLMEIEALPVTHEDLPELDESLFAEEETPGNSTEEASEEPQLSLDASDMQPDEPVE